MAGSFISQKCPQCGAELPAGEQVICQYCGSRLLRYGPPHSGPASPGGGTLFNGVHLKTHSSIDVQGVGIEAFRLLVPTGWEVSGGVRWTMQSPALPAVIALRVSNPNGAEAFEILPTHAFYWSNDPMISMSFPVGSLYFGSEVRPPMGAAQALRDIVVARYRSQLGRVEIVKQESPPSLAKELRALGPANPGGVAQSEGARIRLRYAWAEKTFEEELMGLVEVARWATPGWMGTMENVFWSLDYLFSYRALAEHLDGLSDLFETMLHSFRLNPEWFGRYMQISQYLTQNQIQQINNIGQLSRYISQTNNQISDLIMSSYWQRQETFSRLSTGFSQAIRGVNEYHDPFAGRGVELSNGYEHAWANALGEYILSDDPNFDPNQGSNLNWQPMRRTGPGS